MHDIGKIGVPDSILLKPGELTRAYLHGKRKAFVGPLQLRVPADRGAAQRRRRAGEDLGAMTQDDFLARVRDLSTARSRDL